MNTTAIRVALPDGTVYCTGTINNTTNCTAGQEKNVGLVISPRAGDQLPGGSGVTPGLLDFQYNINAAGVRTNLGAAREVQVLAEWGPIPTAIK